MATVRIQNASDATVRRLIKKLSESGSVVEVKPRVRVGCLNKNIAALSDNVAKIATTSIRHRALKIDVSSSTMRRILTKGLYIYAYTKFD